MPKDIFFFDTETTGIGKEARIVQIAWIKKGITKCSLIKPEGVWEMHPKAFEAHGITKEKAEAEGRPLLEVMLEVKKAIDESKMIVGHNISFDIDQLGQEFTRCGLPVQFPNTACTMKGSMYHVNLPGQYGKPKWPTLQELHRHLFHDDFGGAHDAKADIEATMRCYYELRRREVMQ
jgi:DNA polymerase III epsilon subunit-like protein